MDAAPRCKSVKKEGNVIAIAIKIVGVLFASHYFFDII